MSTRDETQALALTRAHGPVVAICGLAGGAGTSTLAYLIGRYAAAWSSAPMLVTEIEAAAGGLARVAGTTSAAAGLPFATLDDGLRLIAAPPLAPVGLLDDEVTAVLESARTQHALVVVDCGTLQTPGAGGALAAATHVVWTVPRAPWAAQQVNACLLADHAPSTTAAELLAVVALQPLAPRGGGRELRNVAAERCRRLVHVPFDNALAEGAAADPRGRLEPSLAAIQTFVARPAPTVELVDSPNRKSEWRPHSASIESEHASRP